MFEGVPNYPTSSRFWEVCDKHKVNICYTAPTAIRALMRGGDEPGQIHFAQVSAIAGFSRRADQSGGLGVVLRCRRRRSLPDRRHLVANGNRRHPDQSVARRNGDLKPGSATKPLFGIKPASLDNDGNELDGAVDGNLVITDSWPGQMRTVYGDHQRFIETYFSTFEGNCYTTGDGARRDEDGYYWITGRVDDVLNVSGHRMGTAEVESALVAHPNVAEAAVVGYPHDIKGQGIYAYVTLMEGIGASDESTSASCSSGYARKSARSPSPI